MNLSRYRVAHVPPMKQSNETMTVPMELSRYRAHVPIKKNKREPICNFSVEQFRQRIVIKCLECGSKYNHKIQGSWIICSNSNNHFNAERLCTNMSDLYLEKIKPDFEEKNKEFRAKIKHDEEKNKLKYNNPASVESKIEALTNRIIDLESRLIKLV
jgi:hypothetical protein